MTNGKAVTVTVSRFRPYKQNPSSVSPQVWQAARYCVFSATLATAAFVTLQPGRGLMLFWQLLLPSLPLLFVVAPGLWRQVCPMAFVNQLPTEHGRSRLGTLPPAILDHAYLAAVGLFALMILLRRPVLSGSAGATAALILVALACALAGGLLFRGRSGWCGTFCPLGPIQKLYGHAPPVVVPNGYCPTCIGCQSNCYDFNPNAALHADLAELPPRLAEHRALFAGMLPGLVLGSWLADPFGVQGLPRYMAEFSTYVLGSLGAFYAARSLLPLSLYRLTALFGMAAFIVFYWLEAAPMAGAIGAFTGVLLPYPATSYAIVLAAVVVAVRVLREGWRNEQAYVRERKSSSAAHIGVEAVALQEGRRLTAAAGIRERASGRTFSVDPDKTLLEILERGGLMVPFGCRSGTCGADPVSIVAGQENLSPPDAIEQTTLVRLGLVGRARMACMCRAKGPVEVDLSVIPVAAEVSARPDGDKTDGAAPELTPDLAKKDLAKPDLATQDLATQDLAKRVGIGRVIIIGNGVAGTTAAELIRRDSPSCRIDVISRESHHFYNRMALGRVVNSRSGLDGLQLMPGGWFEHNRISVWLNTIARSIDPAKQQVHLGTGETLPYDRLILATGGTAIRPEVPGGRLPGTFVLREAEDALRIRGWTQASACREAIVVGGGVLGVEAAATLVALGLRVTIVHAAGRLLDRHLDARGASLLERFLHGRGVKVHCGVTVVRLIGTDRVQAAMLTDGTEVDAQICVFCVGINPNVALAEAAGLRTQGGIVVDASMRTSNPAICAIGDVAVQPAQVDAPRGLWTLGTRHAGIAVAAMLGGSHRHDAVDPTLHLKVPGIDVRAFGRCEATGPHEIEQIDTDPADNAHHKVVLAAGRMIGAVFVGPPGTAQAFAAAIARNDQRSKGG